MLIYNFALPNATPVVFFLFAFSPREAVKYIQVFYIFPLVLNWTHTKKKRVTAKMKGPEPDSDSSLLDGSVTLLHRCAFRCQAFLDIWLLVRFWPLLSVFSVRTVLCDLMRQMKAFDANRPVSARLVLQILLQIALTLEILDMLTAKVELEEEKCSNVC